MRRQNLSVAYFLLFLCVSLFVVQLSPVRADFVTVYSIDPCEATAQWSQVSTYAFTPVLHSTPKVQGSYSTSFAKNGSVYAVASDTIMAFPDSGDIVLGAWVYINSSASQDAPFSLHIWNTENGHNMDFGVYFYVSWQIIGAVTGTSSTSNHVGASADCWYWLEVGWDSVTKNVDVYANGTFLFGFSGYGCEFFTGVDVMEVWAWTTFGGSSSGDNKRYIDYIRLASGFEFPPIEYPTLEQGSSSLDYYFRSDIYETLSVSAYGLDTDYTNTYLTSNVTFPLIYGFRTWLVSSAIASTELTSGTPTAWIYLDGSETYDSYSSTWTCPETTVNLGYQALKVTVYASADAETWTALASYISNVLITKQIETSEWTFTLQVAFDGADAVYSWGDTDHRSGISDIVFTEPLESEIQLWRIGTGDYIGFILGAYIDVIGEAFYVLCLIGVAGTFYFRYRNFGVIAFFFSIFGGVGGLVWFLVPPWAAAVASALIIIGTSFIVWRVVR